MTPSPSLRRWLIGGAALAAVGVLAAQSARISLQPQAPRTVIAHLFEWTWEDVAAECEARLGPQGFKAVQISPPQEHIVAAEQGYPWWQRYQPVSYQLTSRSGDRAEFTDMVERCRQAGVEVYADAVINHMAGFNEGIGSAGTRFTKYDYPGLYDSADFHPCRQPVKDYKNADDVTQCELVGLADLNTASPEVQQQLAAYLAELVALGVTGFRIDAAKHIRTQELGEILEQLYAQLPDDAPRPYIYQEVIDPGTEAIKKQSYYPLGDVVDFEYGRRIGAAFLNLDGHTLTDLIALQDQPALAPSQQAVVFIDNHDKQRGHGGGGTYLTHKADRLYVLANVFMLAYPYGQVRLMSSYAFDDPDQGPPTEADGTTRPVYGPDGLGCFGEWVCEHRWEAIVAMVGFRNATDGATLTDTWSDGNRIAFGREDRGFVAINRTDAPFTHSFNTQLPPGRYCNVIASESCSEDAALEVDEAGQLAVSVGGMDAIAIHINARPGR